MILCLIFFIIGIALLKGSTTVFGLFGLGAGAIFGVLGGKAIVGTQIGHCPYCQGSVFVDAEKKRLRCPMCNNTIIKTKYGYPFKSSLHNPIKIV